MADDVRRVGILVGRERSFPDALISEINGRNLGVVAAGDIELGVLSDHTKVATVDL